ncbi:MAG TPA: hypothetical protein VM050_07640 [Patescibacteria group bacterium]|nr:hypothetical protein [Patescibacteria group bacterium]
MLRMTGIDLIRKIQEFGGVLIIFYTGYGYQEIADEGLEAGASYYIRKGCSPEGYKEVAKVIKEIQEGKTPPTVTPQTDEAPQKRTTKAQTIGYLLSWFFISFYLIIYSILRYCWYTHFKPPKSPHPLFPSN